ncbi:uncharacterized protein LOC115926440 [Strongylocentrotus purpuratus]|uniref:Farnesoic acid O-methyl transferase domain-containing protein n=1 Tax=Strongylocentrotus purpuratus TaxID=7668 RepID=A0A7M7PC73_STRPU|nr:uncharacterized protein LOC115926440 [Strongylocentrotus purpuratus]
MDKCSVTYFQKLFVKGTRLPYLCWDSIHTCAFIIGEGGNCYFEFCNECPVLHTPDVGDTRRYAFPGFWIAENVTSFDFMVSADNDAHIGLFASNVSDEKYEIVIGGWNNARSVIGRSASSDLLTWRELSPQQDFRLTGNPVFDHYQLSFANGYIKLSRYDTQLAFIDATDLDPLAINCVGIMTGYGSVGYWKFPTFCQESQNKDHA